MTEKNKICKMDKLPFDPPPIIPSITQQLERLLDNQDEFQIHNTKQDFKFWPRDVDLDSLYSSDISPVGTTLKPIRSCKTGEIIDFQEVLIEGLGSNAKNSTSLTRLPGKRLNNDLKGCKDNFPFWPGGIEPISSEANEETDIDFENNLLTVAPGLPGGMNFSTDARVEKCTIEEKDTVDLLELLNDLEETTEQPKSTENEEIKVEPETEYTELELEVLKQDVKPNILRIANTTSRCSAECTEWAEMLDVSKPVHHFDKRIPDPATTWPFELDTFQKQAILKLEEHKHVFVTAHTSAGKTVIAEYAIALSEKHGTKAIYTSPIKALSNQKYREFKDKFKEVGLVTGDVQINRQAPCLIMTTEILRSMLFGGSHVLRDLDFVIFDEVHYINDIERGHVWEETLIMLPDNVCIVMLSATVPNTLDFADWVGRTKKAKMYVISTLKRPIPLHHYLYLPCEASQEKLFLVREGEGPFLRRGFATACEMSKKEKVAKPSNSAKGGVKQQPNRGNVKPIQSSTDPVKRERTYWIDFIHFLKKSDKLPTVAFTLSRNKCDYLSKMLMCVDLTTEKEKHRVHAFFNQSIQKLKEEDRTLPQVKGMESLLRMGIGVHHSGILPILKEIVELLFQMGVVKVLFATETFAMGVNMPARTVAFESIEKFDGYCRRNLHPAEYIQMAGRAGRRGLDKTGTVIILCKKERLPLDGDLQKMMLGKPMPLQSKFRVTYSMILNLLRVKCIPVEEIMGNSFMEFNNKCKHTSYRNELAQLSDQNKDFLLNFQWKEKFDNFISAALNFLENWHHFAMMILSHTKVEKELHRGRVVIITHGRHVNKLALILRHYKSTFEYKVLILVESNYDVDLEVWKKDELYYKLLGLAKKDVFVTSGVDNDVNHLVITIKNISIMSITNYIIKCDYDFIIKDWDNRKFEKKSYISMSVETKRVVNDLARKSQIFMENSNVVSLNDLKINELNYVAAIENILSQREIVDEYANMLRNTPDFESQLEQTLSAYNNQKRIEELNTKLSSKGMLLYEEYINKLRILTDLEYIDDNKIVLTKGKAACQFGSNELIITELLFSNKFKDLQPAEIAALLSSLVFKAKVKAEGGDAELTARLVEGIADVMDIVKKLDTKCRELKLEAMERPNFGLVDVVYKWANGEPFSEIMKISNGVQEGIIVRCIQQLNELINEIKDAANQFGDSLLKKKMEDASDSIKRDIVFAASLYYT